VLNLNDQQLADVGIDAEKLPSTSPANCAVSFEKLVEAYRKIL
jgi:G:T/U-mismatch repair DNA glycosylase